MIIYRNIGLIIAIVILSLFSASCNKIEPNMHNISSGDKNLEISKDDPMYEEIIMYSSNIMRSRTFTPHYVNNIIFDEENNTYTVFMTEKNEKENKQNCFINIGKHEDGSWIVLESDCYTDNDVFYLELEYKLFLSLKTANSPEIKKMFSRELFENGDIDADLTSLLLLFNSETEYERFGEYTINNDNMRFVEMKYCIQTDNNKFLMTVGFTECEKDIDSNLLIKYIHIDEYISEDYNQDILKNKIPEDSGIIINLY